MRCVVCGGSGGVTVSGSGVVELAPHARRDACMEAPAPDTGADSDSGDDAVPTGKRPPGLVLQMLFLFHVLMRLLGPRHT